MTTFIGCLIKLCFHPYVDRRKRSPDASWVTSLRQTGPGGRGKLELELLWASTSGTQTELASGLLLVLRESSKLLFDRLGRRQDIQGVLDLLPWYPQHVCRFPSKHVGVGT